MKPWIYNLCNLKLWIVITDEFKIEKRLKWFLDLSQNSVPSVGCNSFLSPTSHTAPVSVTYANTALTS